MGVGVLSRSCFAGVCGPSFEPSADGDGRLVPAGQTSLYRGLHAAFEIVIEPILGLAVTDHWDKPRAALGERLTLSAAITRSSLGYLEQRLHDLPLVLVKRVALAYLASEGLSDLPRNQATAPEIVLVVPAPNPSAPLQLQVTSSSRGAVQRVLVLFTRPDRLLASSPTSEDPRQAMLLRLCAKCGANPDDCEANCEWRHEHVISGADEQHSMLHFVSTKMPRFPRAATHTTRCFHLRLGTMSKDNIPYLHAGIYANDVVKPGVERPFAVFRLEVVHGELSWRISRRYSEFAQLHGRISELVSKNLLPELPPTKWVSTLESGFLLQRQDLLDNYVKGVLMITQVQCSVPLLAFLGVISTSHVDHVALRSYRREVLHLRVLHHYASPGDVILFHCRGPMSGFQRSMTRSEWDHVAIVVPSEKSSRLQLLEATGEGVTLSPLTGRLLAYSAFHIQYIAFRKLCTPLISQAAVNDLLLRFTAEVDGQPYGLSVRKLLHTTNTKQTPGSSSFFCSELVAEAFKALGIISNTLEASNFWPGSFAAGDFVDAEIARYGAALRPEVIIDSELLEIAAATKR